MSLSATERARFARHVLLPEIGVAGQSRLCAAVIAPARDADAEAHAVARDYLERAGVTFNDAIANNDTDTTHQPVNIASTITVNALASHALRHAAAAFAGAFAAVETIKAITEVGQPAALVPDARLFSEEA